MSIRAEDAQKIQDEIDHDALESAYSCELEYHMAFQIQQMVNAQSDADMNAPEVPSDRS